jgi:hypothetical protein
VLLGERLRAFQMRIVLAITIIHVVGPAGPDQHLVEHVRLTVDLEPDVGELPALLVARRLVLFEIHGAVGGVIEPQREGGKVGGLLTATLVLVLRFRRAGAIDPHTIAHPVDQHLERVAVDDPNQFRRLRLGGDPAGPGGRREPAMGQVVAGTAVSIGIERRMRRGIVVIDGLRPFPGIKVRT